MNVVKKSKPPGKVNRSKQAKPLSKSNPARNATVTMTVSMSPEMKRAIEEAAVSQDRTISSWCVYNLRKHLPAVNGAGASGLDAVAESGFA